MRVLNLGVSHGRAWLITYVSSCARPQTAYNVLFPRLRLDETMAASSIDDAMRVGTCEAAIVPRVDFETWRTDGKLIGRATSLSYGPTHRLLFRSLDPDRRTQLPHRDSTGGVLLVCRRRMGD